MDSRYYPNVEADVPQLTVELRNLFDSEYEVQTFQVSTTSIVQARKFNPAEFAWQFARIMGADCYLFQAPAVVDSPETREALIERCGLRDIFRRAERLDMALLSVGTLAPSSVCPCPSASTLTQVTFSFGRCPVSNVLVVTAALASPPESMDLRMVSTVALSLMSSGCLSCARSIETAVAAEPVEGS